MALYHIALRLSCQQRNLAEERGQYKVEAYADMLTRHLPQSASHDAIQTNMMFKSKFFSVVYATLISTPFVTNGVRVPTVYPCVPDMRSLAFTKVGSSVTKFKPGDIVGSWSAWLILMATAKSARMDSSSSARTSPSRYDLQTFTLEA